MTKACEERHIAMASISALSLRKILSLPVLSAQLITAPTGKPREIRNFAPAEPPRPDKINESFDIIKVKNL